MNDTHIMSHWRRGIRLHLIVAVSATTMLLVWWNQFDFYPYMQNNKHVLQDYIHQAVKPSYPSASSSQDNLVRFHPSTRFSLSTFLSNVSHQIRPFVTTHITRPSLSTRPSAVFRNKNAAMPLRIPPALDQLCYTYNGLTAINNCCQFFNFKANYSALIPRCFEALSSAPKHRYLLYVCVCGCVMSVYLRF